MKQKLSFIITLLVASLTVIHGAESALRVYSDVPGLAASDKYSFRVRDIHAGEAAWQNAFAFITTCKDRASGDKSYFSKLEGWSNSYINFEMRDAVEVEIRKTSGEPIRKATPRPAHKLSSCDLRDGKAYVRIAAPGLIAVDIDGQMDDQDTGFSKDGGYKGPPIHTLTIFANPVIASRPRLDDPEVHAVKPGEQAPSEGAWKTLYFLPGVHDVGVGFRVHAGKNYYIPGNAIVYGSMNNGNDWADGHDIHIFGYGTLSGARLTHPRYVQPKPADDNVYDPIWITGARNTSVEGITIADSAHHSLMLVNPLQPEAPTDMRWLKIFTWRANGDGINPFGNGLIEDCFIRTQDDSTYVNGRGIRRVVYWNDANGSTFVLSALPNRPIVVEDCDVIYARATWNKWSGGRIWNMRTEGGGHAGNGVIFRNIRVSDPRPTLQPFMLLMQGLEPYSGAEHTQRRVGDLSGILFQNISITAPSILGEPDILWGMKDGEIKNLTFENVTIDGKTITNVHHFKHNEHVKDLHFTEGH